MRFPVLLLDWRRLAHSLGPHSRRISRSAKIHFFCRFRQYPWDSESGFKNPLGGRAAGDEQHRTAATRGGVCGGRAAGDEQHRTATRGGVCGGGEAGDEQHRTAARGEACVGSQFETWDASQLARDKWIPK